MREEAVQTLKTRKTPQTKTQKGMGAGRGARGTDRKLPIRLFFSQLDFLL